MTATENRLSTFDRIGIAVVAFLGACIGSIATASDMTFSPPFVFLFPGLVVGFEVSKLGGPHTLEMVVSGVVNGAIYGYLLYGWDRLANSLPRRASKGLGHGRSHPL